MGSSHKLPAPSHLSLLRVWYKEIWKRYRPHVRKTAINLVETLLEICNSTFTTGELEKSNHLWAYMSSMRNNERRVNQNGNYSLCQR